MCIRDSYLWFRDGQVTEHRYWEPRFEPDEGMTLDQAVESIDNAFTDSVEAHRISDVEVGCFLSGGVDSSFVASYFGGQKAFTVGFDNGSHYNECQYAAELAQEIGIDHYTPVSYTHLPRFQHVTLLSITLSGVEFLHKCPNITKSDIKPALNSNMTE